MEWVPTAEMGDDAEVELKRKVPDALFFSDDSFVGSLLGNLNTMRKNRQFCDVTLRVGKQEIAGHRCVLAGSSPYLLKLFGEERADESAVFRLSDNLDCEATEALVEFAYTGRLYVHPSKVRSVYAAAVRLKMDRVGRRCAEWLVSNLDTQCCLEIRAIPGVAGDTQLVTVIDQFIVRHFSEMLSTKQMLKLSQLRVELLTPALEEVTSLNMATQALLVLDWLRKFMLEEDISLEEATEKLHLLYMNMDLSLHDCADIHNGDSANTEMVQDYKRLSKKHPGRKVSPGSLQPVPSSKQYHTITFSPADVTERAQEEAAYDWKTIACAKVDERGMVALATLGGRLAVLSVRQRLNTPSPSGSPRTSRPPSMEKPDSYGVLPELGGPKCATGVGNFDNKLIICGGYDRGECLSGAEIYDPATNQIQPVQAMRASRGRFDLTVIDSRVYAVGGCDGNNELASVECYSAEEDKWTARAPLHMARSNHDVVSVR